MPRGEHLTERQDAHVYGRSHARAVATARRQVPARAVYRTPLLKNRIDNCSWREQVRSSKLHTGRSYSYRDIYMALLKESNSHSSSTSTRARDI